MRRGLFAGMQNQIVVFSCRMNQSSKFIGKYMILFSSFATSDYQITW